VRQFSHTADRCQILFEIMQRCTNLLRAQWAAVADLHLVANEWSVMWINYRWTALAISKTPVWVWFQKQIAFPWHSDTFCMFSTCKFYTTEYWVLLMIYASGNESVCLWVQTQPDILDLQVL